MTYQYRMSASNGWEYINRVPELTDTFALYKKNDGLLATKLNKLYC